MSAEAADPQTQAARHLSATAGEDLEDVKNQKPPAKRSAKDLTLEAANEGDEVAANEQEDDPPLSKKQKTSPSGASRFPASGLSVSRLVTDTVDAVKNVLTSSPIKDRSGSRGGLLSHIFPMPFGGAQRSRATPVRDGTEPAFLSLTELSSCTVGGKVLFATDEWFAAADNLLKEDAPEWREGEFTEFGKWMDGWESRRRRTPGHDFAIIQLGLPGVVRGMDIDTCYFTGNNAPQVGVEAINCPDLEKRIKALTSNPTRHTGTMGTRAEEQVIQDVTDLISQLTERDTLIHMDPLGPGYPDTRHNYFEVPLDSTHQQQPPVATHLKVNMYPDGGIARLRVYGEVKRDILDMYEKLQSGIVTRRSAREAQESGAGVRPDLVDLVSSINGGVALCWSDQHYGVPKNCLLPNRAPNMGNGWETARKKFRSPILTVGPDGTISNLVGNDWAIFKLAHRGCIELIEIDTNHFKGNFPESALIEGCDRPDLLDRDVLNQKELFERNTRSIQWKTLLPRTKLRAHERRYLALKDGGAASAEAASSSSSTDAVLEECGEVTHVRLTIYPDGGVSRLRLYGRPVA
ncbi:unnamed protein product [Vitrella brassicaformis CCMP3155]|uniref:Allantoicase domain-containing protein n=2 Tax=Vitrella brassicaformis TaxID=1169539 RepID=A0A0G4ED04_VITBC|nr:unnamed protein product [Vitrella brassicaformis CCMP3155]|eukprot:CEL93556.1 unnamed protein product [Vitrella brassicaformis CCMP3155]